MSREPKQRTKDLVAEAAEDEDEAERHMPLTEAEPVGVRGWTEDEIADLTRPVVPRPTPVEKLPPATIAMPPVQLPESGEQMLERLQAKGMVREPGTGDPPAPVQLPKRLTIVELDGRESVIDIDPYNGGYLIVETFAPTAGAPWLIEPVHARVGLMSVRSLELVDVEPDGG